MKNYIYFITILFLTNALPGCALIPLIPFITPVVTPIINGAIIWKDGEAHKYYPLESEVLYRATKHALTELEIEIKKDNSNKEKYHISNNKIGINILPVEKKISSLNIRINYLGDKAYAELIYEKVDEYINVIYFNQQGKPVSILDK